jgi:hypothetical protein
MNDNDPVTCGSGETAVDGTGEIDYRNPNIVYFVGNSALPTNTAVGHIFKTGALGLLIDIRTSLILDANITLVSPLSVSFIKAQFIGRYLNRDLDQIRKDLDRYQGQARTPIAVALRAIVDRYQKYVDKRKKDMAEDKPG